MSAPRVMLLAAGHGRRAGGAKAWLDYEGKPMLQAQLEFLAAVAPPAKITVSIQAEWLERCRALAPEVRWVTVDPDLQPLASLQSMIRAGRVENSFVYHVDMPVFDAAVFSKLAETGGDAVPAFRTKRGHPVLLSALTLLEVLRLKPETDRLDAFLRERGIVEVAVESEKILRNDNEVAA